MQQTNVALNTRTIETDLERLLRVWFESELRDGIVRFIVESREPEPGTSISVIPTREGCAPIVAFCENGGEIIYLTVGKNTVLEVPLEGRRYTKFENAGELAAIIQAVVAGRIEEILWTRDSTIVKSRATVFPDSGSPLIIKSYEASNPFSSLLKEEHKYLPYGNESP